MRKSLYILGQLTDEDVEWMIAFGRRRTVREGEVLIRQGHPVEDVYLILHGTFLVIDERHGRQELARLSAGEIVGEMSFVDANPPAATVTAVGEARVLALSRDVLQRKLQDDTGFAARFYHALAVFLSDRLRAAADRMDDGGEAPALDSEGPVSDELDPAVLDAVHLAGRRFTRIVERMGEEWHSR